MKLKKEPALSVGSLEIGEAEGIVTITRRAKDQCLRLRINCQAEQKDGLPAFGFEICE